MLSKRNLSKLKINIRVKYTGFYRKRNTLVCDFHLMTGFKAKNISIVAYQVPLSIGMDR